MSTDYSDETPLPKEKHVCECYKKLDLFGIPLYIDDENEYYGERNFIASENAFPLPGIIRINERVKKYPIVKECELFIVFQEMAKVIPCLSDFDLNILSFWILDVFIEGLETAQNENMSHDHQKITLLWIAYFFNYLQKNNPSRKELFKNLKVVLFLPEGYKFDDESETRGEENIPESIKSNENEANEKLRSRTANEVWNLPLPPEIEDDTHDKESSENKTTTTGTSSPLATYSSTSESSNELDKILTPTERNLKDMKIILEILYRIFARLWVFKEIQSALHAMPTVEEVELPFVLKSPKLLLQKTEIPPTKTDKDSKNEKYLESTPSDLETDKELHKYDYILPLQESEEVKVYLKQYFGVSSSDRSLASQKMESKEKSLRSISKTKKM